MFCADYIASFLYHGLLVGAGCELHHSNNSNNDNNNNNSNNSSSSKQQLSTEEVPGWLCVAAGCLSGEGRISHPSS